MGVFSGGRNVFAGDTGDLKAVVGGLDGDLQLLVEEGSDLVVELLGDGHGEPVIGVGVLAVQIPSLGHLALDATRRLSLHYSHFPRRTKPSTEWDIK